MRTLSSHGAFVGLGFFVAVINNITDYIKGDIMPSGVLVTLRQTRTNRELSFFTPSETVSQTVEILTIYPVTLRPVETGLDLQPVWTLPDR